MCHVSGEVVLNQKKFVSNLLQWFGYTSVTPMVCPLELHTKLHVDSGDLLPTPESYRSLVGKLLFLTHTRLDICSVVQHLS